MSAYADLKRLPQATLHKIIKKINDGEHPEAVAKKYGLPVWPMVRRIADFAEDQDTLVRGWYKALDEKKAENSGLRME